MVQIVPSGESVQLSARSGSTSAVVTLPSLMAKRVSPRNMNLEMAWLCPSVLEWGSRVSGSLAAMFRTFFWAAASGTCTNPTTVSASSTTRHIASRAKRDIEFSLLDDHVERDSSIATSIESVWDGSTGPVRCGRRPDPTSRLGDTIYEPLRRHNWASTCGGPCFLRRFSDLAHEPRAAVERGEYLVNLRWIQVEDQASHAGVAIALDQIEVLGDAEDGDRQAGRIAAGLGDELLEVRQEPEHVAVLGTTRVGHPAVAVRDRPPRAVGKRPADDHRRMRLLDRLRPRHHRRKFHELAAVLRLRLGPDGAHRLDALAHHLEARLEIRPVIQHLLCVPARSDTEEKSPVRDLIQACDLLGGLDRIALHDQAHAGGHL